MWHQNVIILFLDWIDLHNNEKGIMTKFHLSFHFISQLNIVISNLFDRTWRKITTWWIRRKTMASWCGLFGKCWWKNIRCLIYRDCKSDRNHDMKFEIHSNWFSFLFFFTVQWINSISIVAVTWHRQWQNSSPASCSITKRMVSIFNRWRELMDKWLQRHGWRKVNNGVD